MSNIDLNAYLTSVESAIQKLGINAAECRTQTPFIWRLKKGSSTVYVILKETESFNGLKGLLVIYSPVGVLPSDNNLKSSLLNELLFVNFNSSITNFAVDNNDNIYAKCNRFLEGIDENEIFDMLTEVGSFSDFFDDKIKNRYSNSTNN